MINHPSPIRGIWISILIGWIVGYAVKAGGNGRGGARYQVLAMALTYFAIVLTYIPLELDVLRALGGAGAATGGLSSGRPASHQPTSVVPAVVMLAACLAMTLALPVILNNNSQLGLIVMGGGLCLAWFINRPAPLVFKGPFQIGPAS